MTLNENIVSVIRKRPGMYVGDPGNGSGLHMLLWHALEDPLSQHLAGCVHRISVVLERSGHVSVKDDGQGLPLDRVEGTPRLIRTLTTLEEPRADDSSRIHRDWTGGPGLVCINALSVETTVDVFGEGRHYRVRCSRGTAGELAHLGPTTDHGTLLRFLPDPEMFEHNTEFSFDKIDARLQELARLCPALKINLRDERLREHRHECSAGLVEMLREPEVFRVQGKLDGVVVDAAISWSRYGGPPHVVGFVNLEPKPLGSHIEGLRRGVENGVLRSLAVGRRPLGLASTIGSGLKAIVHVVTPKPTFTGCIRDRLVMKEALVAVRTLVAAQIAEQLAAHQEVRDRLAKRLAESETGT